MAMSGGDGDEDDVLSEMNVTPLVDVMLVLLVMFIVTASAVTTAVHVNLPKTNSVAPPKAQHPVVLSISSSGQYKLNQKKVSLKQLKKKLERIHKKSPKKPAQLQADKKVPYGKVGKAMAALQGAGIQKIAVLSNPS